MPLRTIFYFDNTFAGAATQRDVGPLHPGNVNRAFMARSHGEMSFQSINSSVPFTTENDIIWGLQWVNHGSAPADVITSAVDDHWFWRHALTLNNDVTRAWGPQSTTTTFQGSDPLTEQYRGQSIKPVTDIDLYVSFKASFGLLVAQFIVLGAIEFAWD